MKHQGIDASHLASSHADVGHGNREQKEEAAGLHPRHLDVCLEGPCLLQQPPNN